MILAVCGDGDEILIPREAHKSVINGLALSGAVPVYLESRFDAVRQVSLGPDLDSLKKAVAAHPRAKAVVFTYPTYDGIAGNLKALAAYAHEQSLYVLVDEAHGAHLGFHGDLPAEALACGADCVAQSTHKMAGSLTQTSMLHCRKDFPLTDRVAASMAVVQSTSPHYWFLASLDSARQQLALEGPSLIGRALELARSVRDAIRAIPGLTVFGREIIDGKVVSGFDETKITIDFSGIGLDGVTAERALRQQGLEVELIAGNHVLALITLGDTEETAQALLDRLGLSMEEDDVLNIPAQTLLCEGMVLRVDRVISRETCFTRCLPHETEELYCAALPEGSRKVLVEGRDGTLKCRAWVTYVNGEESAREVLEETLTCSPVTEMVAVGTGTAEGAETPQPVITDQEILLPTGERVRYNRVDYVRATAYTHTDAGCTSTTATGSRVHRGTVAVDPRYIPYGTRMFIMASDGSYIYGLAEAEDCGGDIKGDRVDLYLPNYQECMAFGRRRCTVYFLE